MYTFQQVVHEKIHEVHEVPVKSTFDCFDMLVTLCIYTLSIPSVWKKKIFIHVENRDT